MDVEILACLKFRFAPFAVCPGGMSMAIDFVHFETDLVPVDGRGWRGSGGGVDTGAAVGAHGDFCLLAKFSAIFTRDK